MDDIIDLSREKCHRKTAFCYIIMTIPVTLIWSTLNRFVSSISSVLNLELEIGWEIFKQISDGRYQIVRPKIPRRDETTSKNLDRLFSQCRVIDGRLPTLTAVVNVKMGDWMLKLKSYMAGLVGYD